MIYLHMEYTNVSWVVMGETIYCSLKVDSPILKFKIIFKNIVFDSELLYKTYIVYTPR